MSLTRTVPATVPSLFQSSPPVASWKASKNKVPFTFVRPDGLELAVHVREQRGLRGHSAGDDVIDEHVTGSVPVAHPELYVVRGVRGGEEECHVDVGV